MRHKLWLAVVTCTTYCIDRELWRAIEYLKEQVRVLKETQAGEHRILLNDRQRARVAAKARRLSRGLLEQTSILFTPDTILAWYRRLIARKYDGSQERAHRGRPGISQEVVYLVIQFKQDNPRWGERLSQNLFLLRSAAKPWACVVGEKGSRRALKHASEPFPPPPCSRASRSISSRNKF